MFEWLVSHTAKKVSLNEVEKKVSLDEAEQAKQEAVRLLDGYSEVEGVGIAAARNGGYAVKVNVSSPLPKRITKKLREEIKDVPVSMEVIAPVIPY